FKTITSFALVSNNNTAGAALGFGQDGRVALRVGFADGTGAIVSVQTTAGATAPMPYCFGDGSGAACPCGNVGTVGNGCANSIQPSGARLSTLGLSRLGADTLSLTGSGMPNSSALYF